MEAATSNGASAKRLVHAPSYRKVADVRDAQIRTLQSALAEEKQRHAVALERITFLQEQLAQKEETLVQFVKRARSDREETESEYKRLRKLQEQQQQDEVQ